MNLQDGSEVTPVFSDGDDGGFPGQQLERLCVCLVMQDKGSVWVWRCGMYEEEAGWRWGQEGGSKTSVTDMLLEKEHPAAVPPALSIPPASCGFAWVLLSREGRGKIPRVPAELALQRALGRC